MADRPGEVPALNVIGQPLVADDLIRGLHGRLQLLRLGDFGLQLWNRLGVFRADDMWI